MEVETILSILKTCRFQTSREMGEVIGIQSDVLDPIEPRRNKTPALLSIESWLFNRDPHNGSLESPHNWVVFHPQIYPKQPRAFFMDLTSIFHLTLLKSLKFCFIQRHLFDSIYMSTANKGNIPSYHVNPPRIPLSFNMIWANRPYNS